MRARKFSIDRMTRLAMQHLVRCASPLGEQTANRLCNAAVVQNAVPYLIALDAIELDRVTEFRWSPWCAGTDVHRAIAADPIIEGGHCQDFLAQTLLSHVTGRGSVDVVFPVAAASRSDPFLARVTQEVRYCDERVFYLLRQQEDDTTWLSNFGDTLCAASNAASFDVGFCTRVPRDGGSDWTPQELDAMIDSATSVFAAALDGDGYLVWEL